MPREDPTVEQALPKKASTSPWSERMAKSDARRRPKISDVGFADAGSEQQIPALEGVTEEFIPKRSQTEPVPIENLLERTKRPRRSPTWERAIAGASEASLRRYGTTKQAEQETPIAPNPLSSRAPRRPRPSSIPPPRRKSVPSRAGSTARSDTDPTLLPDQTSGFIDAPSNTLEEPVEVRPTLILPKDAQSRDGLTSVPDDLRIGDPNAQKTVALPWERDDTVPPAEDDASLENVPVSLTTKARSESEDDIQQTRAVAAFEMIGEPRDLPAPDAQARADAGWAADRSAEPDADHIVDERQGSGADAAGAVPAFSAPVPMPESIPEDTVEVSVDANAKTGPMPAVDEGETADVGEQPPVHVTVTGGWARALSTAVDTLVLAVVMQAGALGGLFGESLQVFLPLDPDRYAQAFYAGDLNTPIMVLFGLIVLVSAASHAAAQQSIGKLVTRTRLVSRSTGTKPGVLRVVVRSLLCAVGVAAAGVTYFWLLVDREHRTLHDRLAGTIVVRSR